MATKFSPLGDPRRLNVATVQARVRNADGQESLLPIVVPALDEVRAFANRLHAAATAWQGAAFGWQAEYIPETSSRPLGSRLSFTPAEFWIGESGVWFWSMTWEHGKAAPAVEYLDDSGLVRS
jgi:hypothetical protein